jgi:pyruvate/2-oxoglutarate dehydrogenase complex dihydrolipoamide acyltransferase (E2) component
MAEFPVRIPKVSMAITEATLLEHLFSEGQEVKEGDALYVIETEKVETEVSSPASGVIHWASDLGATYAVGTQIAFIDTPD